MLTFYYRPDLCAGSFRMTPFVDALRETLPPEAEVDVVTTLPNRYHSFGAEAPREERCGATSITRIALPRHQSGMMDQSRAFAVFARQALRTVRGRHYDVVFATSSRLMTAVLGAWIARAAGARLYLDIRDIFVDTIKDVAPPAVAWVTRPAFAALERWAIGRADAVNLVSPGFEPYFGGRYPWQRFSYFTNGIDDEFLSLGASVETPHPAAPGPERPLTIVYAGNIGESQGLHAVVPALAVRLGSRVRFQIIGDGGRKAALVQALAERGVENVELVPPVSRAALLERYLEADVLFLHLNDYEAFTKVLPSKVFEYAALGKPVWAGVSGYAAEFLRTEVSNAAVFAPCDVDAAVRALDALTIARTPRLAFLAKYSRAALSRQMAADLLAVAGGG